MRHTGLWWLDQHASVGGQSLGTYKRNREGYDGLIGMYEGSLSSHSVACTHSYHMMAQFISFADCLHNARGWLQMHKRSGFSLEACIRQESDA